ncbi:methyltransferase [Lithospermum erythrorhizon]|uniref:Methyltransferase n=1 Tax=Lithospermum erythrorhizon TaxID=34254 RepID=A0AAV3P6K9_LITER
MNTHSHCLEKVVGIGLLNAIGDEFNIVHAGIQTSSAIISLKDSAPAMPTKGIKQPFDDDTFDFVFSGGRMIEKSKSPVEFASEIGRTLKPEGFLVVHTGSTDMYSFNSFIGLFNCCRLVKSRDIENVLGDTNMPVIREIVMRKEFVGGRVEKSEEEVFNGGSFLMEIKTNHSASISICCLVTKKNTQYKKRD